MRSAAVSRVVDMNTTKLTVDLDADVAASAIESADSNDVSLSEWLNEAAESAIAAELRLTGIDDLELELAPDETVEVSEEVKAEFGDDFLASP